MLEENPILVLELAIAAIKKQNIHVIKRLDQTDCGLIANAVDANGWTLLMHACTSNYVDLAEYLAAALKTGIHIKNNDGFTAFDIAAQKRNTFILDYFIKNYGFTINTPDKNGFTCLLHAAARCNLRSIESLIEYRNANIHAIDNQGRTVLMLIAGQHSNGVTCKATECKSEKDNDSENTIRHYLKPKSYLEAVQYLIEKGCNVNATDKAGLTALDHAKLAGRDKVVEFLTQLKK